MDEILKEGTIKVYRAMELIDGKLYPPMCAKIEGKLVQDEKIGEWQKSKENPDLAIPKKNEKTKEVKYYFNLVKGSKDFKGNKIGDVLSRYNPYFHTSLTPLNDQFDTAYKRPNLVTVEVEIPVADLHSNYKAEKAKNKVGEIRWREGPVSSKLSKLGKPRIVFLSRYCKINRIVPDSEVAQQIKKQLEGTDIKISDNIITPNLANEIKKINVPLEYTEIVKNYYSNKNENINTDNKEKIEQKKNSNIATTLDNYKEQALKLCSKDNPSFKLTMFIKDLVKELSNEEKALLFTDTINYMTKELNKINTNTKENSQTNTQKKGRK